MRPDGQRDSLGKDFPDHHDAELVLKLYDLRREALLRESRQYILREFWPKSYDEVLAFLKWDHPHNSAYRQVSSYWEMAYGMAKHGIVHADYLVETCGGEGMFLLAKVHPWLAQLRQDSSPRAFQHTEWVTTNCETGKALFAFVLARVNARLGRN